jgi:hypothetical protein
MRQILTLKLVFNLELLQLLAKEARDELGKVIDTEALD